MNTLAELERDLTRVFVHIKDYLWLNILSSTIVFGLEDLEIIFW